ncbi:hypothetical protein Y032_0037g3379 [Ancylostoma ceylanicum]|uniref:Uncharacterized protein n=1 Tax=Ancylostoma ceylanicum TaxID=53326 RepID=A0A016UK31_9BILA|nr:hypothetical protein Y032_0037g3379 [Ancylostoma ceylanicum]
MRYVPQLRCASREGPEHRQGECGWRQYRDPLEIRDAESERTSCARPAPVSVGERISCNHPHIVNSHFAQCNRRNNVSNDNSEQRHR